MCTQSAPNSITVEVSEFLQDLRDKMEVARIQLSIRCVFLIFGPETYRNLIQRRLTSAIAVRVRARYDRGLPRRCRCASSARRAQQAVAQRDGLVPGILQWVFVYAQFSYKFKIGVKFYCEVFILEKVTYTNRFLFNVKNSLKSRCLNFTYHLKDTLFLQ
jgi:hypothetical protein